MDINLVLIIILGAVMIYVSGYLHGNSVAEKRTHALEEEIIYYKEVDKYATKNSLALIDHIIDKQKLRKIIKIQRSPHDTTHNDVEK